MLAAQLVLKKSEDNSGTNLRRFKIENDPRVFHLYHFFDDDSRVVRVADNGEERDIMKFNSDCQIFGLTTAGDFNVYLGRVSLDLSGRWGFVPPGGSPRYFDIRKDIADWVQLEFVEVETAKLLISHNLFQRTEAT